MIRLEFIIMLLYLFPVAIFHLDSCYDPAQIFYERNGMTKLQVAVRRGKIHDVESLISDGHQLTLIDASGKTPLHCALERDYVDIARLLITSGIDVNVVDKDGEDALQIAVSHNLSSIVDMLLPLTTHLNMLDTKANSLLHIDINLNYTDIALKLIHAGIDLSIKDSSERTALDLAEQNGMDALLPVLSQQRLHHANTHTATSVTNDLNGQEL